MLLLLPTFASCLHLRLFHAIFSLHAILRKDDLVTGEVRRGEGNDEAGMSETHWEPVKRPHENICQFAQCKQAATMCLGVGRSNPWIMHQLARGYCSAQPVKAGAEGVSVSVCDRGKM